MAEYNISISGDELDLLYENNTKVDLFQTFLDKFFFAHTLYICIISIIEIPIMLLTLYALCFLIKSHRAASVFVIHLILSDLIQIICLILTSWKWTMKLVVAHDYSVIVGLYFMACIAFERYVLVAHPIWHKTHETLKSSCLISLIIWFVPLVVAKIVPPHLYFNRLRRSVAHLIPYPIIILCFIGTWRALSQSISLTAQKRRMVLAGLFLVLFSYTFIILPYSITNICIYVEFEVKFDMGSALALYKVLGFVRCLLYLNPLADCLLYLFMRTDVANIMPSLRCCCTSDTHQISVRYTTRTS